MINEHECTWFHVQLDQKILDGLYSRGCFSLFLTFVVMFVDTYASWHIISVIILPKSGEGNWILDKDCVGLCAGYQRTIFSVQWEPINFHWTPGRNFTNEGIWYTIRKDTIACGFPMTFHQITNMTWKISTMVEISLSIENKYFGGDCNILLEFSQFLDMLWCIFFHKNQSLLASVRWNAVAAI